MQNKIIVFKESRKEAFLSDLQTFGVIIASFTANHYLTGGNNWVDGILTIMLVFWALSSAKNKIHTFYNVDDVVKFLTEKNNDRH